MSREFEQKPVAIGFSRHGEKQAVRETFTPLKVFAEAQLSTFPRGNIVYFLEHAGAHADRTQMTNDLLERGLEPSLAFFGGISIMNGARPDNPNLRAYADVRRRTDQIGSFARLALNMLDEISARFPGRVRLLIEASEELGSDEQREWLEKHEELNALNYLMINGYFDEAVMVFKNTAEYAAPISKRREQMNVQRMIASLQNPSTIGLFGHWGAAHSSGVARELQRSGINNKSLFLDKMQADEYYFDPQSLARRRINNTTNPLTELEWYKLALADAFRHVAHNTLRDDSTKGLQVSTKIGYEAVRRFNTMDDVRAFQQDLVELRGEGELSTLPVTQILAEIPMFMEAYAQKSTRATFYLPDHSL